MHIHVYILANVHICSCSSSCSCSCSLLIFVFAAVAMSMLNEHKNGHGHRIGYGRDKVIGKQWTRPWKRRQTWKRLRTRTGTSTWTLKDLDVGCWIGKKFHPKSNIIRKCTSPVLYQRIHYQDKILAGVLLYGKKITRNSFENWQAGSCSVLTKFLEDLQNVSTNRKKGVCNEKKYQCKHS